MATSRWLCYLLLISLSSLLMQHDFAVASDLPYQSEIRDGLNELIALRTTIEKGHIDAKDIANRMLEIAEKYPREMGDELRHSVDMMSSHASQVGACLTDKVTDHVREAFSFDISNIISKFTDGKQEKLYPRICQRSPLGDIAKENILSGLVTAITFTGYNLRELNQSQVSTYIELPNGWCKKNDLVSLGSDYGFHISVSKQFLSEIDDVKRMGVNIQNQLYNIPECGRGYSSIHLDKFGYTIHFTEKEQPSIGDLKFGKLFGRDFPNGIMSLSAKYEQRFGELETLIVSLTSGGIDALGFVYKNGGKASMLSNNNAIVDAENDPSISLVGKIPIGFEMHANGEWVNRLRLIYIGESDGGYYTTQCLGRNKRGFRFYGLAPKGYEIIGFTITGGNAITSIGGVYRKIEPKRYKSEFDRHYDRFSRDVTNMNRGMNIDVSNIQGSDTVMYQPTQNGVRDLDCR